MLRSVWINAAAMRHHGKLAVPAKLLNAARVFRRVSETLAQEAALNATVDAQHCPQKIRQGFRSLKLLGCR